jgi:hypothetical protein
MPLATNCGYNTVTCGTIRIYIYPDINASVNPNPAIFCPGSGVTLCGNIIGGTAPFTYIWRDCFANVVSTNSCYHTNTTCNYTLTVQDRFTACPSKTITVPVSVDSIEATVTATNLLCYGASDACASININKGVKPYNYLWNFGGTAQTECNLAAGTYTVQITDSLGCTKTLNITISQPPPIVCQPPVNPSLCAGDSAILTPSCLGGTPPYLYSWSNGSSTSSIKVVAPGNYSLKVTDSNGCTSIIFYTVTAYPLPTIIPCPGIKICPGQCTKLCASGALTYVWSPTVPDPNNVCPAKSTTYTVTGTDANGCQNSATMFIKIDSTCVPPVGGGGTYTPD